MISVTSIVLIVGGVVSVSSQRIMETGALIMLVVMLHNESEEEDNSTLATAKQENTRLSFGAEGGFSYAFIGTIQNKKDV